MPNTPNRLSVERVQWLEALPVLRLVSAFKYALQPGKLIVALVAVVVLHGSGLLMDAVWERPGDEPSHSDAGIYPQRYEHGDALRGFEGGIYEQIVVSEHGAFKRLMYSGVALKHGVGAGEAGVLDALREAVVDIPAKAFDEAPWFTIVYGAIVLFVLTLAGGVICRMAATQICLGRTTTMRRAVKFVGRRWLWYLLTPLMPAGLVLLIGCVLMLAGLIFFNAPVLDVIGSVLYGLLMLMGFVIALICFASFFAVFLMTPSMSVEGTDSFDAIARAYNYVLFKPWQFAGYLFGSVIYLAVVYAVVVTLGVLTYQATHNFVEVGSFTNPQSTTSDMTEHGMMDSMRMDTTRHAVISDPMQEEYVGASVETSSWIVARWVQLLIALCIAVLFSVVCCLQTQVYVLMRRASDTTPMDDCAEDDEPDPWSSPADMVDPEAQAIAAAGPQGHPLAKGEKQSEPEAKSDVKPDAKPEAEPEAEPEADAPPKTEG